MSKIILRIKGGLGNQLFIYAAGRRLADVNNAELVIDNVTGFVRDHQYRRKYMLDRFNISARIATPAERLEPFERYRRAAMQWLSRRVPYDSRKYLQQDGREFDSRLLALKVRGTLYLDGLWQSELFFSDVESTIRKELRIIPPVDELNQNMFDRISASNAVALHVRLFDANGNSAATANMTAEYYRRAVAYVEQHVAAPHYFLFSDDIHAAYAMLDLPNDRITLVIHNQGDANSYADLWLMAACRHCITANSTFSWWGAWLNANPDKLVITPAGWFSAGNEPAGLVPAEWIRV